MYKGIIEGLSNSEYHENRTHISSSVIKTALEDPNEFQRVFVEGGAPSPVEGDAVDLGSLVHTMILEPHLLNEEYAFFEGARRQGSQWDHFKAVNGDKTIITRSQKEMADNLFSQFASQKFTFNGVEKTGPQLLLNSKSEESFFTEFEGHKLKVRTDSRSLDLPIIWDVKTTMYTANTRAEAAFIIEQRKYELSAALYVDIVEHITGIPQDFYWIFLSKADKRCNIYKASKKTLERGRQMYKDGLELIKEWKKLGRVPTNLIQEV